MANKQASNISDQGQFSPAREKLKEANAALLAAQQAVKDAGEIVTRAEAAVAAAHRRVDSFGDLDQRCVAFRVQALKSGADSAALPGDLKDLQREKVFATEELQHVEVVLEAVREDYAKAAAKQSEAEKLQSAAAVVIYTEKIQAVVDQFTEARRVTKHFEVLLKSTGLPFILPQDWVMLPQEQRHQQMHASLRSAGIPFGCIEDWLEISRILARGHSEQIDGRTNERIANAHHKARAYWKDFADRLLSDPHADPGLPPIHPHLLGHNS